MNNRIGTYKKNLSGEITYKSFVSAVLPPNPPIELNNDMVEVLVKTGKKQKVNCANVEGLFRIIQSVPSKKAEPFKKWLARVG